MSMVTFPSSVSCSFYPEVTKVSESTFSSAEVYFAQNKDFGSGISSFERYLNKDDKLKAERSHKSKDQETVLICYTFLRFIISARLNKNPGDISYIKGTKGKPQLKEGSLFFNISHTRDAFAIAISEHPGIGVDLEGLNKNLNFEPIVKRFFSEKEAGFIHKSPDKSIDRFFLLWTRKEAMLKAIGTGIIPHFSQIEVCSQVNLINRNSIDDLAEGSVPGQFYIYSMKLHNYYISVALPQQSKITLCHLNEKHLNAFFT